MHFNKKTQKVFYRHFRVHWDAVFFCRSSPGNFSSFAVSLRGSPNTGNFPRILCKFSFIVARGRATFALCGAIYERTFFFSEETAPDRKEKLMANPQKENGFTAIANELLEQLIHFKPTSTQYGIMLFIMRRTYGFQRNYAPMSLSYIAKAMNTSPQVVYKGLRQLKEMNMVEIIPAKRNNPQQIKVQKDWQRWVSPHGVSPVQCISHTVDTGVSHTGDISISHTVDQERNNRKKHKKETYCTCACYEHLWTEYPSKIGYAEIHRALEHPFRKLKRKYGGEKQD